MSYSCDDSSCVSDSENSTDDSFFPKSCINDAIASLTEAYRCCLIRYQEGDSIEKEQMYSTMLQIRNILAKAEAL
ncbi:hypothetical protein QTN25_002499 [Entamoeba marina]